MAARRCGLLLGCFCRWDMSCNQAAQQVAMHMVLIEGMEVEEVGGGAQVAAISGIGHTSYSQSANVFVCFSKWGHGLSCLFVFLWRV